METHTNILPDGTRTKLVAAIASGIRMSRVVTIGAGLPLVLPTLAVADDRFTPESIFEAAGETGSTEFAEVNGSALNARITDLAGWLLGVAIAIFVLKVILTAIDRMLIGGDVRAVPIDKKPGRILAANQHKPKHAKAPNLSFLEAIPIVGVYPKPDANPGARNSLTVYGDNGKPLEKVFGDDIKRYTWPEVWLTFAKNLAICIGAWVIVNALVGLVSWLMTEGIGGTD